MTASKDAPTRAMRGASLLILLQIVSRAITFIANQVLLRFLTAQLLGISTQLEVYYLSVIFFARESLRVAIQRQDLSSLSSSKDGHSKNHASQAIINLGYLSILLGVPLSILFGYLYVSSLSASTLALAPNLIPSLYIYALASILELLSEPIFMLTQTRLEFSTRARAESIATFLRCTITLTSAVYLPSQGVLPFALGQLSYSLGLLAIYVYHGSGLARREGFSLLPSFIPSAPSPFLFHPPTLTLTTSLLSQSVLKHLLTQGDTFLVSILSSPTSQGVYALANNYGGLLARLVFQPIEESSRTYFSRLLSPPTPSTTAEANRSLTSLLRFYLLFSLPILALGPPAAPLLLSLVAGPKWLASGAGDCLSAYMYYIPLLAINGITEAFVASVAKEREVHKQSMWMAGFSVIFAGVGFVTLRVMDWGATGLVVANGVNLGCRIIWCWGFIRGWLVKQEGENGKEKSGKRKVEGGDIKGMDLREVLPGPVGVGVAAVAGAVVRRVVTEDVQGLKSVMMELVKVAGVGVVLVSVLAVSERSFIMQGIEAIRGRREGKTI